MISNFFHTFFYEPLYNGLIIIFNLFPSIDAGFAVIVLTLVVKVILFPLSIKATKSQMEMKSIENDLNIIKNKYKNNKKKKKKKIVELYKEKEINPFSGIFVILIQLPIIITLYRVFISSGLPDISSDILYSFVHIPDFINMNFLGLIDIRNKSVVLAVFSGLTSFLQAKYAQSASNDESQKQSDFLKALNLQMKFGFPVLMFIISLSLSSAVALYFITSNVFTIFQEIYLKHKVRKVIPVN